MEFACLALRKHGNSHRKVAKTEEREMAHWGCITLRERMLEFHYTQLLNFSAQS